MGYSFTALFAIILVLVMANQLQAEPEGPVCTLANHWRDQQWSIGVPQNIYGKHGISYPDPLQRAFRPSNADAEKRRRILGNATVDKSLAWTWNDTGSDSIEAKINKQINAELFAHYNYLSMAAHFDRDDIHLPGFAKFFRESAEDEHKHARMFMEYLNRRGGRVKLNPIMAPCSDQWGNGRMAMMEALKQEKDINQLLLDLHGEAEKIKDFEMTDFIESNFLNEQIESIKKLANYVNTLNRIGDGLGEYQFDKLTLSK